ETSSDAPASARYRICMLRLLRLQEIAFVRPTSGSRLPRHPSFGTRCSEAGEIEKMRVVLAGIIASATVAAVLAEPALAQESLTMSVPPVVSQDHPALLSSADPRLAANKKLVYDMYRVVLQAGRHDRAHEFIAEDYIQHNPNA